MAIFHFSMKTISRSSGRSATAAIAYRAGETITDERTGEVHRYEFKKGVVETGIVLTHQNGQVIAPDYGMKPNKQRNAKTALSPARLF